MKDLALRMKPSDLVAEYEEQLSKMQGVYDDFIAARDAVSRVCSVGGTSAVGVWGRSSMAPTLHPENMQGSLLRAAWNRVWITWIKDIASSADAAMIEVMLQEPPEFTMENLKDKFGSYIADPKAAALRGMAEVFSSLDPFYRSHTKVGVGRKGLPKKIILSNVIECAYVVSTGPIEDVVNALRVYRVQERLKSGQVRECLNRAIKGDGTCELSDVTGVYEHNGTRTNEFNDGISFRTFKNGNVHIIFDEHSLEDINKALSEYYGDVLPDVDEKAVKKQASTAVSKDLQYYPTPVKVAERMVSRMGLVNKGDGTPLRILEPSCGCGRLMDAIKKDLIANDIAARVIGVEYDPSRAKMAKFKGHSVVQQNFLEFAKKGSYVRYFDQVIMNPPFYGKHYVKHIEAALKLLRPHGTLTCIVPASAIYHHKIVNSRAWLEENGCSTRFLSYNKKGDANFSMLPVGSFSESGTNINTGIYTITKLGEK